VKKLIKIDSRNEAENFTQKILRRKFEKSINHYNMKLNKFIKTIFSEFSLNEECILVALIYLERLIAKEKIELRASNWKPLLLTSIILAVKYWEDCEFWNYDFLEF